MGARRATRKSEITRQRLLLAAEEVFAENGFEAARLVDVAERAGIQRASIVYYYRNKRELYEAVLASALEGLSAFVGRLRERPEDPAEAAITAWVDFLAARPTVASILLRELVGGRGAPALVAAAAPSLENWRRIVEDGRAAGRYDPIDPVHALRILLGASVLQATRTPLLGEGSASAEDLVGVLRRLLGTRSGEAPLGRTQKRARRRS